MTLTWSGAAELPQVPFGRLFRRLDRPVPDGAEIVTAYTDGQVTLRSNRAKIGYHEAADLSGFKGVEVGDFVVHGLDILRGSVGIADSSGAITAVCTVCEPVVDLDPRYVAHVIRVQAKSGFTRALARGIREGGADFRRWGTLAELPIPVPPVEYQGAVCDYLDRETGRIDTLIEEQQRLIEMLRERRADLISHAVLDATSQRTQLRRLVDVIDCAHVTAEFVADDYRFPVASIRECQGVTVDLSACNYTTAEFFEHLRAGDRAPRAGDLLFIRNVSVGLVSIVAPDLPEFAMGQETVLLRRKSDVHPAFLRYALVGAEARHAIEGAMIGSTFRRINVSAIRSLPVPTPLIDEQRRIAAQLDQQTAKIDTLIAEAERFIDLSRERRVALLTAAVTGQIDVREMV